MAGVVNITCAGPRFRLQVEDFPKKKATISILPGSPMEHRNTETQSHMDLKKWIRCFITFFLSQFCCLSVTKLNQENISRFLVV